MKRTITNPHKTNHKMYILIILISVIILSISLCIQHKYGESSSVCSIITEIVQNLSYGCLASTLVAWRIDCVNTKNANQKFSAIYDTVYNNLKIQIICNICLWAEICEICFGDTNYNEQYHTWTEWYSEAKESYYKAGERRQKEVLPFIYDKLSESVKLVNSAISEIQLQRNILTINDVMNRDMNTILDDFQFEFYAYALDMTHREPQDLFSEMMDATINDLAKYINNWSDIAYVNNVSFKPRKFTKGHIVHLKASPIR